MNTRKKLLTLGSSMAVLLLTGSATALRVGEVCNYSDLTLCGPCENGEFQAIQGGDKLLCAPVMVNCDQETCSCCGDLNGHLS